MMPIVDQNRSAYEDMLRRSGQPNLDPRKGPDLRPPAPGGYNPQSATNAFTGVTPRATSPEALGPAPMPPPVSASSLQPGAPPQPGWIWHPQAQQWVPPAYQPNVDAAHAATNQFGGAPVTAGGQTVTPASAPPPLPAQPEVVTRTQNPLVVTPPPAGAPAPQTSGIDQDAERQVGILRGQITDARRRQSEKLAALMGARGVSGGGVAREAETGLDAQLAGALAEQLAGVQLQANREHRAADETALDRALRERVAEKEYGLRGQELEQRNTLAGREETLRRELAGMDEAYRQRQLRDQEALRQREIANERGWFTPGGRLERLAGIASRFVRSGGGKGGGD